jgi:cell division protein FtsB
MRLRISSTSCLSLVAFAVLIAGCGHEQRPDLSGEVEQLKTELDDVRGKLEVAGKALAAKQAELAAATTALEAGKIERAERDQVISQRESQIRSAQTEIDALKKRDAFVFAEIRALHQQGATLTALNRYRQFLRDFPNSPLAANATAAIAELTTEGQREIDGQGDLFAVTRQETRTLDYFRDGLLTPQEMAPMLKRKTRTQVFALLGRPNFNFPDGKEVGYNDKATNPVTGKRGMLIISFDSDEVSALRVDYAGRPVTP